MTLEEAKILLRKYFEDACRVLGIDSQSIVFCYDHIGQRFKSTSNTCEVHGSIVYVNEDWIVDVLSHDFIYDLEYQMYHEARHFYQGMVISFFHRYGKCIEPLSLIQQWESEFANYKRNEGTIETQRENAAQKMEIDANAFAIAMLVQQGKEARAPLEQWKETEQRVWEIINTTFNQG